MRGPPQLSTRIWITAITSAAASAIVVVLIALILERPRQIAASSREITASLQRAAAIANAGQAGTYPANAVCLSSPERAAADVSRALQQLANGSNLKVSSLSATAEAPGGGLGALAPISIQVSVEGPYDGLMRFLAQTEGVRPEIFLSNAELRSQSADASLTFQGQSFCANFHPLG